MNAEDSRTPAQASGSTRAHIDQGADKVKQAAHDANEKLAAAGDRAEAGVDAAADAGAHAAHRAADKAADWRERGASAVDGMRECTGDWFAGACDWVREKPVESVAIALAAGWLVGWLLHSRR